MTLQAGFAEIDITPPAGCELVGQFHRRVAERVRDPLAANALVLASGEQALAILSLDIIVFPEDRVARVRDTVAAATGIPADAILIAATHTHTGPPCNAKLIHEYDLDSPYQRTLDEAAARAVIQAWERRRPAELACGKGYVRAATNRRTVFRDGTGAMYGSGRPREEIIGLEGPTDPEVNVVVVRDASTHTLLGALVNYACHATCVESARFVSADYPGAVRAWLQNRFGPETGVVYLNGACGNLSPSDVLHPAQTFHSEEGMAAMGQQIGACVEAVLNHATAHAHFTSGSPLGAARAEVQGPLRSVSDETYAAAKPKLAELRAAHPDPATREGSINREIYYAQAAVSFYEQGARTRPFEVQVLRLGHAAVVSNPCECFVEHGLQIKSRSPAALTLVSELANGYAGYLPTRAAMRHGGYETWLAESSCLDPAAADTLVAASQTLLDRLWA